MSYNYQDAPRESQQEYFGKVHTDNKETLCNALKRIEELEKENRLLGGRCNQLLADKGNLTDRLDQAYALLKECAKYVKAIRNYNIYFSTKESSDKPDTLLADVEKFLKGGRQ